jgi:hypothetical protein
LLIAYSHASFKVWIAASSSRMLSWCTQHAMLAWVAHTATSPLFYTASTTLLLLAHAYLLVLLLDYRSWPACTCLWRYYGLISGTLVPLCPFSPNWPCICTSLQLGKLRMFV